jgi:hypothetical protein
MLGAHHGATEQSTTSRSCASNFRTVAPRPCKLEPHNLQQQRRRSRHSLSLGVVTDGRRLIEPVRSFLAAPRCAVLSTLGPDGAPRQIVVHYMLGENHIQLNGNRDRRWWPTSAVILGSL